MVQVKVKGTKAVSIVAKWNCAAELATAWMTEINTIANNYLTFV
jgi:hypothetical protein